MIYGWIIGGLAALDLGVKSVVEGQEDDTFPRDLPSAKGFIKLHKNHNSGFPFGFMKERPELVKGIPLMVISAMAGALAAMMQDKGKTGPVSCDGRRSQQSVRPCGARVCGGLLHH